MKRNLIRSYDRLSNLQKAQLYFRYFLKRDHLEMRKVDATVAKKNYTCLDGEFTDARDAYFDFALVWGLDYWRTRCFVSEAVYLFKASIRHESKEGAEFFMKTAKKLEAKLLGLEAALKNICQKYQLPQEAFQEFAGISANTRPYENRFADEPDISVQKEYENLWRQ